LLEQRAAVRLIRRPRPADLPARRRRRLQERGRPADLPARRRRRLQERGLLPEYLNGRARVRVTSPRSMWR